MYKGIGRLSLGIVFCLVALIRIKLPEGSALLFFGCTLIMAYLIEKKDEPHYISIFIAGGFFLSVLLGEIFIIIPKEHSNEYTPAVLCALIFLSFGCFLAFCLINKRKNRLQRPKKE